MPGPARHIITVYHDKPEGEVCFTDTVVEFKGGFKATNIAKAGVPSQIGHTKVIPVHGLYKVAALCRATLADQYINLSSEGSGQLPRLRESRAVLSRPVIVVGITGCSGFG